MPDDNETQSTVDFACKDGYRTVYIDDIIYIEAHSHRITVHTLTGSHDCNGPMSDIDIRILSRFIAPTRGMLVNPRRATLKGNSIVIENGPTIHISRRRLAEIRTSFL